MAYEFMYNVALDIVNKKTASGEPVSPDDTVCVIYSNTGRMYTGMSKIDNQRGMVNLIHAEVDAIRNMQSFGDSGIESLLLMHVYSRSLMLPCGNCLNYVLSLNPVNSQCWIWGPERLMRITELGSSQLNNGVIQPGHSTGVSMNAPDQRTNSAPFSPESSVQHNSISQPMTSQYGNANPVVSQHSSMQSVNSQYGNAQYNSVAFSGNHYSSSGSDRTHTTNTDNARSDYLKKRVRNIMEVAEDDDPEEVFEEKKGLFSGLFGKK